MQCVGGLWLRNASQGFVVPSALFLAREPRLRKRKGSYSARRQSAIFAIQQVAHGFPAGLVRFFLGLPLDGIHTALRRRLPRLRLAALRTTIGKARLVGLQLKLLRTNTANLDGKRHRHSKESADQPRQPIAYILPLLRIIPAPKRFVLVLKR